MEYCYKGAIGSFKLTILNKAPNIQNLTRQAFRKKKMKIKKIHQPNRLYF